MRSSVFSSFDSRRLSQLIVAAGAALVVTIIAIIGAAIYWLHGYAIDEERKRLTQLTLVIAEQVERSFDAIDVVLGSAASRARSADFGNPAVRRFVQSYLAQQSDHLPQAQSFLVWDRRGDLIIDSENATPRAFNGAARENFIYLRNAARDDVHVDAPIRGAMTHEWLFTMSRRLKTRDGEFNGVAVSGVNIGYFTEFFRSIDIGPASSVSLVRADGIHMLRYPVAEEFYGRSFANGRIHKEHLPRMDAGIVREASPVTGDERLIAFRRLGQYPVVLIVTRSLEAILAPWAVQAYVLSALGAAAIFVVCFIGIVLTRMAERQGVLLAEAQAARGAAELASKAAERASRAKSDFLAGVSHDLRTPLNAINGFSEILLGGLGGALTEKMREYVGFIHTSGQHLLSLLNNLLDLAKIEANRMTILDDDFAVASVVEECLRLVGAQADAGRVTLKRYEDTKLGLRADPVRLRQILFNLLSNAIKFTPPGGSVEVRSILLVDGALRLSVVDTGIGMSANEIPTALQPYGQVTNAHTRSREGTGLGLPLVKALVELHDGGLDIESAAGKGTAVHVTLPASRVLHNAGTRAA